MSSTYLLVLVRSFFRGRWNAILYGGSILGCLFSFFIMLRFLPHEESLSLHYNVYYGIDFIGSWKTALLLPVSGIVLVMINGMVGMFTWRRDTGTSYFIAIGTVVLSILVVTASALTVYVNL